MKVLMVTPELPRPAQSGTLGPVARQIESIRRMGVEVTVVEPRGAKGAKYLQSLPRLWSAARQADLVHAHYGFCGWLARASVGRPIVVSFMGDDLLGTPNRGGRATAISRLFVRLNRRLARSVDAVIVKSSEMAGVVAPVSAHVIPNGVDLELFQPMDCRAARSALGWTGRERRVLFPGNPADPRKGFSLARIAVDRAAAQLHERLELITLRGVAANQVPAYMNACDAMLMVSLWEGSPNVVKEALACNLPIVSVPVGDVSERLEGVSGCHICTRDSEALGQALYQALQDGRRTTGRAALARDGLDQESVARAIIQIYTGVLDHRSVRRGQERLYATR